eukprot:3061526-Pyramimonas_sp.AAC.1
MHTTPHVTNGNPSLSLRRRRHIYDCYVFVTVVYNVAIDLTRSVYRLGRYLVPIDPLRLNSSVVKRLIKGLTVDVKGSTVDVKGLSVDVKGSTVDVKGLTEDSSCFRRFSGESSSASAKRLGT